MPSEPNEEILRKTYLELQMLEETITAMSKQRDVLNNHIAEIDSIVIGFDEMKNIKPGTPIKTPLAQGIYVDATITKTEKVLMNVGADCFVPKTLAEATKLLERQKTEIITVLKKLENDMGQATARFSELQNSLMAMSQ